MLIYAQNEHFCLHFCPSFIFLGVYNQIATFNLKTDQRSTSKPPRLGSWYLINSSFFKAHFLIKAQPTLFQTWNRVRPREQGLSETFSRPPFVKFQIN